jgi:hypothetical protein
MQRAALIDRERIFFPQQRRQRSADRVRTFLRERLFVAIDPAARAPVRRLVDDRC